MNSLEVKAVLLNDIRRFTEEYRIKNALATNWKAPMLGFADAKAPGILSLRKLVSETHYMPQDLLPDCTIILSYFLPFSPEIGKSNREGDIPSATWATAYTETNRMFVELNRSLARRINEWGYRAAAPQSVGMIDNTHLYSNWSQRHIACAAGLGTFGVNNMLITEAGTCGRFHSLVTNLPLEPDRPLEEERCLYKRNGTCGLCVKRCPVHALDLNSPFKRSVCASRLDEFEKRLGAHVCGKCTVDLPCTYRNPLKKS